MVKTHLKYLIDFTRLNWPYYSVLNCAFFLGRIAHWHSPDRRIFGTRIRPLRSPEARLVILVHNSKAVLRESVTLVSGSL